MTQRLGEYELVRELGSGAMGAVFLARHAALGREVAIKVLRSQSARSGARFTAEAEAVARLQHPHVVKLHEARLDAPEPYLVLSYVEGESLAERLRRGPLAPERAVEIALQVADALAHAHAAGILHRDLKPGNVLLGRDGRAQLTDFGLARALAEDRERLTRTGEVVGTPAFMSPEQAAGEVDAIGPATDVYGLGATLYAMLSGQPPFRQGNLLATVAAIAKSPPRPLRALRPGLDPGLVAVVDRCLEKAPARRFPSASALADALREVDLTPRPRQVWPLTAAIGLALAGVGATWALWPPPEPARPVAPAPPPPATPSSTPTPATASPWALQPGQVLTYDLARWREDRGATIRTVLAIVLVLRVQEVEPEQAKLTGFVARHRLWRDGGGPPVRYDSSQDPRTPPRFEVVLDPRDPRRFDLQGDPFQGFVDMPGSPSSFSPDELSLFFTTDAARYAQGALQTSLREQRTPQARTVWSARRVEARRLRRRERADQLARRLELLPARLAARNGLRRVSQAWPRWVVLPTPSTTRERARGIRLKGKPPFHLALFHARPWGEVLGSGKPSWHYTVLRQQEEWVELQWGGGSAWVLRRATQPPEPHRETYRVIAEAPAQTRPRDDPKLTIGRIPAGQVYYAYLRPEPGWLSIQFDDRKLYVRRRYLKRLP